MVPINALMGNNFIDISQGAQTTIFAPGASGILEVVEIDLFDLLGGAAGRFPFNISDGFNNVLIRGGFGWQAATYVTATRLISLNRLSLKYENGLNFALSLTGTVPTSGVLSVNMFRR